MSSASDHSAFYCVYPPPPPTVNNLSSRQKAQLRRSNLKLTKVLGAAPQVVDELPPKISAPLALSASRKLQPSLCVAAGKLPHKRSRSVGTKLDPELYPLSSTPRPTSREGHARRSSESKSGGKLRGSHSRSRSPQFVIVNDVNDLYAAARPRPPKKEHAPRPESYSRDSLCDSLFEPNFSIPSATKIRREKMARVCKLLGEDVPVDLVFPAKDDHDDYCDVLDICAPLMKTENNSPPPTPPKPERKPALPPKPEQPRWLSYRTPLLETIVEQSPRASYSSTSSADSGSSLLTTTTTSSYRFTSSGCPSASDCSPPSSTAHETVASDTPLSTQQIQEMSSSPRRREFAIYVPFRRWTSRSACQTDLGKDSFGQEFEVVRGLLDLRV